MGALQVVVVEPGELIACAHLLEVMLDDQLATDVVRTKPSFVSGLSLPDIQNVSVGFNDKSVGDIAGGFNPRPILLIAAIKVTPLVVDVRGDSEITREPDPGNTFNSGVQALAGPITIDVDEGVRRFDGVVAGARMSEVVRRRDWGLSYEMMPGESKAIETKPLTIMSDIDGIARIEDSESVGIIEGSGVRGVVVGLES